MNTFEITEAGREELREQLREEIRAEYEDKLREMREEMAAEIREEVTMELREESCQPETPAWVRAYVANQEADIEASLRATRKAFSRELIYVASEAFFPPDFPNKIDESKFHDVSQLAVGNLLRRFSEFGRNPLFKHYFIADGTKPPEFSIPRSWIPCGLVIENYEPLVIGVLYDGREAE